MIIDEAHIIKNRNTRTFAAAAALGGQFEGCLALTGTPLDNTWEDEYALLSLLKGHPIADFNIFLKFKRLMMMAMKKNKKSQGRKSRGKASRGKKDDGTGWLHLIEAQQHAYHPMLVQLNMAHTGLTESMRQDVGDAIPDDMDDQALEQVAEWCRQLEPGDNSLS
ncbi:hypothetical protein FVEG_15359 [Fusarium verticillioides 7600]|uniref:SNF2 N-terminal domain-containing protein n=1 Tax=Gibberella moniliformis (strain M3125 / FGSC 7600) TaxID=334819 RepID=W7LTQ3_GIBM7|nr:hypothetical protein FVEG_15359 [Fusarium verticillioides 7600]EWG41911.1 hypothetical protein FVEG_15359 [Fusarium verticillioides 7600]RBR21474.1 hypothetical protein FVER53590_03896 [Fusarium verticillioides]